MIDEKKLIEILSKNSIFEKITNAEGKNIFEIIDEQPKTDWIPCSERLPEEYKSVLICAFNGFVYIAERFDGKFCICDDCDFYYEEQEISAWQPLPQPYKKEGDT